MARPEKWVDQMVFRWDAENASGSTGFGPVAWSGSREQVEAIFRITGPMLRSGGDAGTEETRPALVRVEDQGGRVVLVRRAPVREAGGRTGTVCHVLAGSREVLDPGTCLGLHGWDWPGAAELPLARVRGALDRVPEAALLHAAVAGQQRLAAGLAEYRDELAGAVAELLRHPDGRFTLLDRSGGAGACRVLYGLYSMFGEAVPWPWTFATHDTAELPNLRYVFVGRWAGAATRNTDRRRADPRDLLDDRAAQVADGLVHRHLDGLARGDGHEYEVDTMLRTVATERRAPLLDAASRALDLLTSRPTGWPEQRDGGERGAGAAPGGPPPGPAGIPDPRIPPGAERPPAESPDPYADGHDRGPASGPEPKQGPGSGYGSSRSQAEGTGAYGGGRGAGSYGSERSAAGGADAHTGEDGQGPGHGRAGQRGPGPAQGSQRSAAEGSDATGRDERGSGAGAATGAEPGAYGGRSWEVSVGERYGDGYVVAASGAGGLFGGGGPRVAAEWGA
ncbi:MAG TPA: hypothetical protein VIU94_34400, partial [Streptomyces sp.]